MTLADSKTALSIALKYNALNLCVIPSGGGDKHKQALVKWKPYQARRSTEAEIMGWERTLHPTIWAVVTGCVSRLFIVDCDDPESIEIMESERLVPHVRTAHGNHYYFRWPEFIVKTVAGLLPHVDVRGEGGYANFAGRNESASYDILMWPERDSLYSFTDLPRAVREPLVAGAKSEKEADIQRSDVLHPFPGNPGNLGERILQQALFKAEPGTRNGTGFWLACQLRDNGFARSDAESLLLQYGKVVRSVDPDDPYTEREAIRSLDQAYLRPARKAWSLHRERRYTYV